MTTRTTIFIMALFLSAFAVHADSLDESFMQFGPNVQVSSQPNQCSTSKSLHASIRVFHLTLVGSMFQRASRISVAEIGNQNRTNAGVSTVNV